MVLGTGVTEWIREEDETRRDVVTWMLTHVHLPPVTEYQSLLTGKSSGPLSGRNYELLKNFLVKKIVVYLELSRHFTMVKFVSVVTKGN